MKDIRITAITMKNWKCFKFKTFRFNEGFNQFQQENGFGKSSLFEAIIYCLYGKLPISNSNDLKNDIAKDIVLNISLKDFESGKKFEVERIICSPTKKYNYLIMNGNKKEMSAGQINDFLASFFGKQNIFPLIWSNTPMNTSKIYDFNFIKDEILKSSFEESDLYLKNIKSEKFNINKEIKKKESNRNAFNDISKAKEELEKISKEIKNISKELKENKTSISDSDISKAKICIQAKEDLENLLKDFDGTVYSQDEIQEYESLKRKEEDLIKLIDNYNENQSIIINDFSIFNKAKINKIIKENNDSNKCPCCGSNFIFSEKYNITYDDLENLLNSKIITEDDFTKAKEDLEKLSRFNSDFIDKSKEIHKLEITSKSIQNPEEIIKAYSKELNDKWELFEQMQQEEKAIQSNIKDLEDIVKLKEEFDKLSTIEKCITNYNKEKINNLISSVLVEAINILSKIDQKYLSLFYDIENNNYQVVMASTDKEDMKVLSVNLLSSGEKSVVAMALTMAYRHIIKSQINIPNFLLLDESLSALDESHLNKCFEILSNENIQSFIINHN